MNRETIRGAAGVALMLWLAPAVQAQSVVTFGGKAEVFAPGVVSSPFGEVRIALSPDGNTALWGSTDRPGGAGGWDIWMSQRQGADWSAPRAVSFNAPENDFDPSFDPDGENVYFFSNRSGGAGGDDLYRVSWDGKAGSFGQATSLGPEINTAGDEWAPVVAPDGRSLMFASDGHGGRGKHDLFVARGRGTTWGAPTAIVGMVNTSLDEFDATWLSDGSTIVFSRSENAASRPIELLAAQRRRGSYSVVEALGNEVNVSGGYTLGPAIGASERDVLYFTSARAGGPGKLDIYRIRYRLP